jgi:hypothetical protein
LILLRIFKFTIFRSTFFASAIFIPKSPKKYFTRNPQWFQYVTDFLFWSGFWHRPCINISRTRTKPSIYGRIGRSPAIDHVQCSMGQSLTYVSIRPRICGNDSHGDVTAKRATNPMPRPW